MTFTLSNEQFADLSEYFELALVATTQEEDVELVAAEPRLRDMLRGLIPDPPETH